ncbi:7,8-didemethyl-8-hydroxy-5-deazariboflavin synthase subunit CofG [Pleurocapsa sp. CCALA 161]|uniref:7,8-didemethyl-8-hydroxy-5-deazariboflavin synthase subunit CofG n=1 Tax=Pleurocapsa sp. CCALA 161 TaxID=2107688 RepID=UPI000D065B09|nr:7,8-didemethyl-8-hydroxy-5-deazariboflavin synthase subunit CofG [Pleurocapsa sp. CCALA 161]PSB07556.1 7,8-didemethyl-8-hydroxy-5-deazariboflavin synthase subunit CofG [Pleurocapsa sp. CCALA 161]
MSSVITFSPAHTIVPTYECFNRCSYCNFRLDPEENNLLTKSKLLNILKQLDSKRVAEILILSGEVHPQSSQRSQWFAKVKQTCDIALSLGFLPHTNVGPLSWSEMKQLKKVNVSMGLMLEQINPKFMKTVHKYAPSKEPELRSQQLEWAGKLNIPFTTGILLGIGETQSDIADSLQEIARIHQKWGHIQEVILQPHSVGTRQKLDFPSFDPQQLPAIIAQAKTILPSGIAIQIPPNLIPDASFLLECLGAGATDLGGISPLDEVNPDYPHPTYESLSAILQPAGWSLKARLPVYPQYFAWLPADLQKAIAKKKKSLIWKN